MAQNSFLNTWALKLLVHKQKETTSTAGAHDQPDNAF